MSVRRETLKGRNEDDGEWSVSVETEPTVLPKGKMWKDDVRSELPFREVVRRKAIRANGIMIDDQRVIVICVSVLIRSYRVKLTSG